ncbi:MAG: hypothetical protein JWQ72_2989 [Polaromonas sp.]|nr:hypothetical protein [Polaromonas sp.]
MASKQLSISDEARAHDRLFHDAFTAATKARASHVKVRPHRSITALAVTPWLLAQTILLPILMCALLLWCKPLLLDLWRACILFWSSGLGLPFGLSPQVNDVGHYVLRLSTGADSQPLPGATTMLVTLLVSLLGLAASFTMKKALFPLKYPLRIVCVLQLVALAYFWFRPDGFPYTIARHSEELMTIGYVVMLSTPVMLAMGYYILNQPAAGKVLNTLLILGFMAVLVPHQVLAQAFLMQHLSVLFMPVLYICFGAVFDALVFVALYSWVVSKAPPGATV